MKSIEEILEQDCDIQITPGVLKKQSAVMTAFTLVKAPKNEGGGLSWIGVPEKCDRCREEYPMSWIIITDDGKRFLCAECDFEEGKLINSEYIQICDVCHNNFSIHEMTIEYNQLVCRRCSYNAAKHRQKSFEEHD